MPLPRRTVSAGWPRRWRAGWRVWTAESTTCTFNRSAVLRCSAVRNGLETLKNNRATSTYDILFSYDPSLCSFSMKYCDPPTVRRTKGRRLAEKNYKNKKYKRKGLFHTMHTCIDSFVDKSYFDRTFEIFVVVSTIKYWRKRLNYATAVSYRVIYNACMFRCLSRQRPAVTLITSAS